MNRGIERPWTRSRGVMRGLVLAALAVALVAPTTQAQERRERRPADRQELERRVRQQMTRMIRERLELTEAESDSLSRVMERFQEERRALVRSEVATRRRVEALLREGAQDQAEARELVMRLVELRAEESRLFAREQEALLQVLTPAKVLELHEVREQINRRIRAVRGRRGGNDRGPPGVRER